MAFPELKSCTFIHKNLPAQHFLHLIKLPTLNLIKNVFSQLSTPGLISIILLTAHLCKSEEKNGRVSDRRRYE